MGGEYGSVVGCAAGDHAGQMVDGLSDRQEVDADESAKGCPKLLFSGPEFGIAVYVPYA